MQTPKFNIGDVVRVVYPGMKWKHTGAIKSIKEWNDGSITYDVDGLDMQVDYEYMQKSPPSSPETPIVNKQDFGEAIEIVKSLYTEYGINQKVYKGRYHNKYWRLLSILSSK